MREIEWRKVWCWKYQQEKIALGLKLEPPDGFLDASVAAAEMRIESGLVLNESNQRHSADGQCRVSSRAAGGLFVARARCLFLARAECWSMEEEMRVKLGL